MLDRQVRVKILAVETAGEWLVNVKVSLNEASIESGDDECLVIEC